MELHPMWDAYPELKNDLVQTLAQMEKSVNLKNKQVEEAILAMIHAGGKMLRPAYQILFSGFGPEKDTQKTTALAAAIEMLHTATLIHDDIVDEADLRRNLPTIRASFGNSIAVYAGDYLFVSCFKLLSNYASSIKSLQINSRSMEKILDGELGQMDNRYNTSITLTDYLSAIEGKTAELFALSCAIGAYESGASTAFAKSAEEIGMAIGMAFQILDDILDYSQDASTIGKPVLEDVKQGVYSLPLILALESNQTEILPLLKKRATLSEEEQQELFRLVHASDSLDRAHQLAEDYTTTALKKITKLPDTKGHERELLTQLTIAILNRKN